MKTLILIRHAKSSWKENNLSDFQRPLNKRGKRDAPIIGKVLLKMGLKPDMVISSPAVRASDTAEIICTELGIEKSKIHFDEDIYEAATDDLLEIIQSVEEDVNTLLIFGHNPGLTNLSNFLTDQYIDNIPTTGVVGLSYVSGKWTELNRKDCKIIFFEFPKKYLQKED
jgi:phosphohistidine phosphatase